MMGTRFCAMVAAILALAGCASSGYDGYYGQYPNSAYRYQPGYSPYYDPYDPYNRQYYDDGYGFFGSDSNFDDRFGRRSDRYVRPADNVVCDLKRDICFDQHGPSYKATKRYLGKHEANAAFRRNAENDRLFSPGHGVTCDRTARACYDSDGIDKDLTRRVFGNRHRSGPGFFDVFPRDADERESAARADRLRRSDRRQANPDASCQLRSCNK